MSEVQATPDELQAQAAAELEIAEYPGLEPGGAGAKIMRVLRELSTPASDATERELALASFAMGLESVLPPILAEEGAESVDRFVLRLLRFLALLRSNRADMLLVVEMPRRDPPAPEIPPGAKLHRLDEAWKAALTAESPL